MSLIWSYGVLTVPSRAETLLPRTLASLAAGGFTAPRLFVDGARDARFESIQYSPYPITYRGENIRTFGNWVLALWELFLRNPHADRYALFEDDFVTYRNLKEYLDVLPFPSKAYLNLYLHPWNKSAIPIPPVTGLFRTSQKGYSAVALVFDRRGVSDLLSSQEICFKPRDPFPEWWKKHDGTISRAMTSKGYTEFSHYPSLVQHTGEVSVMGNAPCPLPEPTFLGEDFNALEFLNANR